MLTMKDQALLRLKVSRTEAEELEKSIRNAYSNAGQSMTVGQFSYDGPSPGAFGFGEGFLDLVGESWSELMKIPDAVKILAQGIANYLESIGNTSTFVFTVTDDGQICGSFKATGKAAMTDSVEIAKSLTVAVQNMKANKELS